MPTRIRRISLAGLAAALPLISLALAPAAAAHTPQAAGEYQLEIGWLHEPALVGQPNGVQVTVTDHHGAPVTDLVPGALAVMVSTAGQDSAHFDLLPVFDAEEGTGPLGEYDAALVPTAPGEYSFHIEGVIHGTTVDLTLSSQDGNFDTVVGSSEFEFPAKLPNLTEIATRLDRIDSRIEALRSTDPGTGALAAAQSAADAARIASASADRALLFGAIVGGAGILLAVVALAIAMRAGRRGPGTA